MLRRVFWIPVLLLAILPACGGAKEPAAEPQEEAAMKLELTSAAFEEGSTIPTQYTCDGPDVSTPLSWSGLPAGAKSLALIGDDPDAPVGTWVHWVLYDLPPDVAALAKGLPPDEQLANGGKQGKNDFGKIGYCGPCPPRGSAHRYFFKLYALDAELNLSPGATKKELLKAMEGHILAEGQLMGRYQRQ
jgi:Raf kinase inhibitor-like YbhB/YbcL family protein